ncbi:MAG: dihydropyrimidinase [Chloroflexota bacterium]|nr:dihydropyrimidinase [Chloroflexota bacterium]
MKYDLVIKNGTLVTATDTFPASIGITDGRIAAIGQDLSADEVVDATGLLVLPGFIDPHVHLDMPTPAGNSSDDWFTGTRAAAFGGTTTVIDFVEPQKDETLLQGLDARRELAASQAVIDFTFHMTLARTDDATLAEIPAVIEAGLISFKCYTTYAMRLDDDQLLSALKAVGSAGGLTIVHSENDAIVNRLRADFVAVGKTEPRYHPLSRPAVSEGEAVERVLALAQVAGAPVLIVHVSTQLGVEAIQRAKARGQTAFGETCPQYLLLTDERYSASGFEGAKFICAPPLRKTTDQNALWDVLASGAFRVMGTDHCPFFYDGTKNLGRPLDDPPPFTQIPGGIPGIEARPSLLYSYGVRTGRLSLNRWVDCCSTGPAQTYNLYPRKGALVPGADADIVLFDPNKPVTLSADFLHEHVDYTPYEGFELNGWPLKVFSHGQLIIDNGEYVGAKPRGQFIARKT